MLPVCSPFFTRATSFQTRRCKFHSTWIRLGRGQECSLTKGTGFRSTAPWSSAYYTGMFMFAITGMCRKQWEQGFISWQSRGTKPSFTLNLYTCLCIVSRIAWAMKIKLTLQTLSTTQYNRWKSTRANTERIHFSYYELSKILIWISFHIPIVENWIKSTKSYSDGFISLFIDMYTNYSMYGYKMEKK